MNQRAVLCYLLVALLGFAASRDILESTLISESDHFVVRVSALAAQPRIEFWSKDQPADIFEVRLFSMYEATLTNSTASVLQGGPDATFNGTNVTSGDNSEDEIMYRVVRGSGIPLGLLQWDLSDPVEEGNQTGAGNQTTAPGNQTTAPANQTGTANQTATSRQNTTNPPLLTLPPGTITGANPGQNGITRYTVVNAATFNLTATGFRASGDAPFQLFQLRIHVLKNETKAKMEVLLKGYQWQSSAQNASFVVNFGLRHRNLLFTTNSSHPAIATSGNGWFSGLGDAYELSDNSTVSGGNQNGQGEDGQDITALLNFNGTEGQPISVLAGMDEEHNLFSILYSGFENGFVQDPEFGVGALPISANNNTGASGGNSNATTAAATTAAATTTTAAATTAAATNSSAPGTTVAKRQLQKKQSNSGSSAAASLMVCALAAAIGALVAL